MRCVAVIVMMGALVCLVLMARPSRASLCTPEDPMVALPFGTDGKIRALDGGELSRWLLTYINALDGTKKNGMGEWPNLTEQVFEKLKSEKVPEPVLEKLAPLKNKEYSPDDFVVELNKRLSQDDLNQFQIVILKNASKGYDDRFAFLVRIERLKQIPKASVEDKVALAGYELRVGRHDQAISLLTPLTRDRQPNYFVFQTLSHLYADGGDWKEALRYQQEGQFDTEMPPTLKGLTNAQRDWWKKLDSEYVPALYHIHFRDTELRKGKSQAELDRMFETEDVPPLFPLPNSKTPQAPVRFVNDAGIYHPGQLAASEKAKLPEDAIPIVQQLLLWFPRDALLYWLLAELYAANNQFKNATTFFDKCAGPLQFSKRKIMMDHRAAVRAVVDQDKTGGDELLTQSDTVSPPPQPVATTPISMRTIWYYFGAIGLIAVFAVIRALYKRSTIKTAP